MTDNVSDTGQRYSVYIPSPGVKLNMGNPDHDEGFGYKGFTVSADPWSFFDTNKYTLWQAGTHSCWQIGGNWMQYANGDTWTTSNDKMLLGSGENMSLIAGAHGVGQVTALTYRPDGRPRLPPYNNLTTHYRVSEQVSNLKKFLSGKDSSDSVSTRGPAYASKGLQAAMSSNQTALGYESSDYFAVTNFLLGTGDNQDKVPAFAGFLPYPAYSGFTKAIHVLMRTRDITQQLLYALTDNNVVGLVTAAGTAAYKALDIYAAIKRLGTGLGSWGLGIVPGTDGSKNPFALEFANIEARRDAAVNGIGDGSSSSDGHAFITGTESERFDFAPATGVQNTNLVITSDGGTDTIPYASIQGTWATITVPSDSLGASTATLVSSAALTLNNLTNLVAQNELKLTVNGTTKTVNLTACVNDTYTLATTLDAIVAAINAKGISGLTVSHDGSLLTLEASKASSGATLTATESAASVLQLPDSASDSGTLAADGLMVGLTNPSGSTEEFSPDTTEDLVSKLEQKLDALASGSTVSGAKNDDNGLVLTCSYPANTVVDWITVAPAGGSLEADINRAGFTSGTWYRSDTRSAEEVASWINANASHVTAEATSNGYIKIQSDKKGDGSEIQTVADEPIARLLGIQGLSDKNETLSEQYDDEMGQSWDPLDGEAGADPVMDLRAGVFEINKLPEDTRNLARPLLEAMDDAADALKSMLAAYKAIASALKAFSSSTDDGTPQGPKVGIFGQGGISMGTDGHVVGAASGGFVFNATGTYGMTDTATCLGGPERLAMNAHRVGSLKYSPEFGAGEKPSIPTGENKPCSNAVGFIARSGTDIELTAAQTVVVQSVGEYGTVPEGKGLIRLASSNAIDMAARKRIGIGSREAEGSVEMFGENIFLGMADSSEAKIAIEKHTSGPYTAGPLASVPNTEKDVWKSTAKQVATKNITLAATENIHSLATKEAAISVGPWVIRMEKDGAIEIGQSEAPTADPPKFNTQDAKPYVKINDTKIEVGKSGKSVLTLEDDEWKVVNGAGGSFALKDKNVTVNGAKFEAKVDNYFTKVTNYSIKATTNIQCKATIIKLG